MRKLVLDILKVLRRNYVPLLNSCLIFISTKAIQDSKFEFVYSDWKVHCKIYMGRIMNVDTGGLEGIQNVYM